MVYYGYRKVEEKFIPIFDNYREREGAMLALTDARKKANEKYIKNNYTQVKLSMPNTEAKTLEEYCTAKECSKAGFIRQAIKEKMEREPITELEAKNDGVLSED